MNFFPYGVRKEREMSIKGGKEFIMRYLILSSFVVLLSLIIGCSIQGIKSETGNPIPETKISQIIPGKTTATDVLGLFGAPTMTTTLGNDQLFIYKNCKTGGTGFTTLGFGQTNSKERCNSLSITIDKTTGLVLNKNYQKMFATK